MDRFGKDEWVEIIRTKFTPFTILLNGKTDILGQIKGRHFQLKMRKSVSICTNLLELQSISTYKAL